MQKAETPDAMHKKLFEYARNVGLIYICTPTDEDVADYIDNLGVVAFKLASYVLTHHNFLKHIARKGKPIILSTGADYFSEVAEAVEVIKKAGNDDIILLQCVGQYPADYKNTNLKVMSTYEKAFNTLAGISDHSLDPYIIPYSAAGIGAKVIEKHFTLDRNQDGPDHGFAIEPSELKQMVIGIRKIEKARGNGIKTVVPQEIEIRKFTKRCLFAIKDIKKGEALSKENIDVLRPGTKERGIEAKFYDIAIDSTAGQDIQANKSIKWKDILK